MFILLLLLLLGVLLVFMIPREGFVDLTALTQRISSITDIIISPDDGAQISKPFYSYINERNTKIRKGTVKYLPVEEITSNDRIILRDAYQYARAKYPLPLIGNYQLCITSDETEGGMPHTHGDTMYISLKVVRESTPEQLHSTFIHELSHIHQRQQKHIWEKLYEKIGFHKLHSDWAIPKELRDKVLANPDTWEGGHWEYKGQYGMMVINDDAKTIRDHHYQVIPTRSGVNMTVNHWKRDFGMISHQVDHPNEITASALEKFVSTGNTGSNEMNSALRCWLVECKNE